MKKILFLTTRKFFPQTDGALIYSFGLFKKICGFEDVFVDLASFYEDEDYSSEQKMELKNYCKNIYTCRLSNPKIALNLSLKYSNTTRKYLRRSMIEMLKKIETHYDCVFVDRVHMFSYSKLFNGSKIILISHNIENHIWFDRSKHFKGIKKKLVERSAKLLKKEEDFAFQKSDNIISISENDCDYIKYVIGSLGKVIIVPPINDYHQIYDLNYQRDEKAVLFMGSYDYYPNEQAAMFLINEMGGFFKENNITMYLVGKKPTDKMVDASNKNPNIVVTGFVESVDDYIQKSSIFINAVYSGSGMNIKMLEAFGKGIPTISSEVGARGISNELKQKMLIFNSVEECKKLILQIFGDKELSKTLISNGLFIYKKMTDLSKRMEELI